MSTSENSNQPTRRDFIRLAAASLGGTILAGGLASCGGNGGGGSGGLGGPIGRAAMPNGYTFYRVFIPGNSAFFPDVNYLNGGVSNNDTTILLHAQKNSGQNAIFQLTVNYNGTNPPSIFEPVVHATQGDVMADGSTLDKIGCASLNNNGVFSTLAAVLTGLPGPSDPRFGTPMLWQDQGDGLTVLAKHLDPTPNGGQFGAHMGDVAINDNGDILLCADYTLTAANNQQNVTQGVFLLSGGQASNYGSLLTQTRNPVQGSSSLPARFGLCDLDNSGNYVAQAFYNQGGSGLRSGQMRGGLIGGHISGAPQVLYGPGTSRGVSGNMYLGPRVTNGNYSSVIHTTDTDQTLQMNGQTVTSTGQTSPSGATINGIGPAAVSQQGLLFYLLTTNQDMELIVSNGVAQKTILRYGDTIQGSSPVEAIVAGLHSNQVDSQGRIVFNCEFQDGSQAIIVGIPT